MIKYACVCGRSETQSNVLCSEASLSDSVGRLDVVDGGVYAHQSREQSIQFSSVQFCATRCKTKSKSATVRGVILGV